VRLAALRLLACPGCGGYLELKPSKDDPDGHVMEGTLRCDPCTRRFPITRGIPRLVDQPASSAVATASRFSRQWQLFDDIAPHHRQQFLDWVKPLTPETFCGQTILEGGCGKGRHSRLLGDFGAADVLAIDLGDSVEVAFRNTRTLPNVHIVQMDLMRPAIQAVFDLAISIGVLHHLPAPREGFRGLLAALRPGGRVVTWTYGLENNEWIVRWIDPVRKRITSHLPAPVLLMLVTPPSLLLWGASKIVSHLGPMNASGISAYVAYIERLPLHEITTIVFDQLTPTISHYLPRHEIQSWYSQDSLEGVLISWHNQNSWRATGVWGAQALR